MLPLEAVLTILAIKSTLVYAGTRPRNVRDMSEEVYGVIPPKRTVAECWSDNYYNLYCDGNCIGLWSICDGITDCKNGEDETHAICHVPSYQMKPGEKVEVHLRNIKKMNGIFFMPCLKGSCGIIHVWGATRDGKLKANVVTGSRDMGPHPGYGDSLKKFRPANAKDLRDDLKIFVVRKTNGSLQVSLKNSPQFAIDFRHSGDKLQLRPWKWNSNLWKSWRVYGDIEDSQWFRCRNGELVNDDLKCNAVTDCNDGSDEDWAMCEGLCTSRHASTTTTPPRPRCRGPTPRTPRRTTRLVRER